MKIAIIVLALSMVTVVVEQVYELRTLQIKVECLQGQVENEYYNARYNIRILNHNKRLNDENIEIINGNTEKLENLIRLVLGGLGTSACNEREGQSEGRGWQ